MSGSILHGVIGGIVWLVCISFKHLGRSTGFGNPLGTGQTASPYSMKSSPAYFSGMPVVMIGFVIGVLGPILR